MVLRKEIEFLCIKVPPPPGEGGHIDSRGTLVQYLYLKTDKRYTVRHITRMLKDIHKNDSCDTARRQFAVGPQRSLTCWKWRAPLPTKKIREM